MKVLAINPGSTSTKVALFEDGKEVWSDTQRYDIDVIRRFKGIPEQEEFRFQEIMKAMASHGTRPEDLDGVVGRGGLLRPIPGGTYEVNEPMLRDVRSGCFGAHASNLGAPLALRIAEQSAGKRAFIVDPVVVDEMIPEARVTGLPEIERRSLFHALNQKAVARRTAADLGRPLADLNLIIAHMGGGISVGAHDHGRIIDVNNALDGQGPFSPERAGSLPSGALVRMAYSGEYDLDQIMKKIVGGGGLVAHLGTSDLREVEKMMDSGNDRAKLVFEALGYHVAREIGACAASLCGRVDAIALTGGLAYSARLVQYISAKVSFIARVLVYPGEDEMKALADGALRVLEGREEPHRYGD